MVNNICKNIQHVRLYKPLVWNITNQVVMNNTANALLAIGALPIMSHEKAEFEDLANIANVLVVNIGTMDDALFESTKIACSEIRTRAKPWVLDPVGAGASKFRTSKALDLLKMRPTVVRGNASEIMALANAGISQSKGVDSYHHSSEALASGKFLADKFQTIVCISGAVDFIICGSEITSIKNGHQLMTQVTGLGCTATALIGAFVSVNDHFYEAAVTAVALLSVVGELAEKRASGPGTLQTNILDLLYSITEKEFLTNLKKDSYESA